MAATARLPKNGWRCRASTYPYTWTVFGRRPGLSRIQAAAYSPKPTLPRSGSSHCSSWISNSIRASHFSASVLVTKVLGAG